MSSLNAERIELIRTWETASLTLSEITRLLEKRIFTAQDKIYRSGQVQQVYLLGIFLLGLALIVSLLVVYTSVLQRRISALLAGTVQLAAGDRGFRVAPGAEDSLGQLAMSFNKMAEQLQAQDVQIELQMDELRRSRDEVTQVNKLLESRVKERTRNLEAVNQELLAQQEEERKLFRQLEETNNQLIHAEKMASVGQLAAGVAHEINNPIGFVRSNLSTLGDYAENLLSIINAYEESEGMLKDHAEVLNQLRALKEQADLDFIRKDINELIQESLGGADRITRIVQDLKSFSRVGTEEWEWADVQQGLESTLNVVWHDLKYQANVVKEYGNPPEIQCVLSQLNQVFMNILLNAGQAMDEHGTITIRTGSDDGQVWVQIEDTGHGIAKETRDKIFDPFFTTKSVGKGTGLGLSVSYGIVERHRGSIEVDSEPGKGTIFTIRLPIHATDAGDTPELVQASGRPN
ncbi:MAG: histidine kinase [Gammaproteobacteria bacterium]|nr:MAG: histidine kinase [Gammaproteobacteria bacterium]